MRSVELSAVSIGERAGDGIGQGAGGSKRADTAPALVAHRFTPPWLVPE